MNANEPQFWMMIASIIIAVCFIVMAGALIAIAVTVKRVVATVKRVEERVEPLIVKVDAISAQGKEISVHFNEISANLSTGEIVDLKLDVPAFASIATGLSSRILPPAGDITARILSFASRNA